MDVHFFINIIGNFLFHLWTLPINPVKSRGFMGTSLSTSPEKLWTAS